MKLQELLASPAQFIDQKIVVEGVLVVRRSDQKFWHLVEDTASFENMTKALRLEIPKPSSILGLGFTYIPYIHDDPFDPLFDYCNVDDALITGTLVFFNELQEFIFQMSEAVISRSDYTFIISDRLTLRDLDLGHGEILKIPNVLDQLSTWVGKQISIEGVLIGNHVANLFYLVSDGITVGSLNDESAKKAAIRVSDSSFTEKIKGTLDAYIATDLMYRCNIHIVGQVSKSYDGEFLAVLTSVQSFAVQQGTAIFQFV